MMNEGLQLSIVVLAITLPIVVLIITLGLLYMQKEHRTQMESMLVRQDAFLARQEKHVEGMMDRFLSRNFEEFGMTNMIKQQVEVDAQEETESEEESFEKYYDEMREKLIAEGVMAETAGATSEEEVN